MGVGAMKRLSAVKWGLVSKIVWAWVLTLPVTAILGYATYSGVHFIYLNGLEKIWEQIF